jgi:hypothetical protein
MNDGRAIEVPGLDDIRPVATWAVVVLGADDTFDILPYRNMRPHNEEAKQPDKSRFCQSGGGPPPPI